MLDRFETEFNSIKKYYLFRTEFNQNLMSSFGDKTYQLIDKINHYKRFSCCSKRDRPF